MKYVLVTWPESQLLYDHARFNECLFVEDMEGHDEVGSSAYMCPEDLYKDIFENSDMIRWRDRNVRFDGYYINNNSQIHEAFSMLRNSDNINLFAEKRQAISVLAYAQITQIIKNDKRFGGEITKEEWNDNSVEKYAICNADTNIIVRKICLIFNFIAFHTKEQAELFVEENIDLLNQYFMI